MKRKLMSMVLVVAMALSLLPTTAFAEPVVPEEPEATAITELPTEAQAKAIVRSAPLAGENDVSPDPLADPYGITAGTPITSGTGDNTVITVPLNVNAQGLTWHTASEHEKPSMYHIGIGVLPPASGVTATYYWDWGTADPATLTYRNWSTSEDSDGYHTFYLTCNGKAMDQPVASGTSSGGKGYVAVKYTKQGATPSTRYVVYTFDFTDATRSTVTFNTVKVESKIDGCSVKPSTTKSWLPNHGKFADLAQYNMGVITLDGTLPDPADLIVMMKNGTEEVELSSTNDCTYNKNAKTITLKGDRYVTGDLTITDAAIKTVDVAIDEPAPDGTPDAVAEVTAPDAGITTSATEPAVTWTHTNAQGTEDPFTSGNFKAGETYTATVTLKADSTNGYKFAEEPTVTLNTDVAITKNTTTTPADGKYIVDTSATPNTLVITKQFKVEDAAPTAIQTVTVTDLTPAAGATADISVPTVTTTPVGTNATATVEWADSTGKTVTNLAEGETYTATITVTPGDGCEFTAKDTTTVSMGTLTAVTDPEAKLTANQYRINAAAATDPSTITIVKEYEVKAAPKPVDITGATVTLKATSAPYTGSAITPEIASVTLADGKTTLSTEEELADFEATYAAATTGGGAMDTTGKLPLGAGKFTVTVTPTDATKYTGTATADFTITKATRTIGYSGSHTIKGGDTLDISSKLSVSAKDNAETVQYTCVEKGTSGYITSINGCQIATKTVTADTPVKATITVTAKGTANYEDATQDFEFEISKLAGQEFTASVTSATYGDEEVTLTVTNTTVPTNTTATITALNDVVSVADGKIKINKAGTAKVKVTVGATTYNTTEYGTSFIEYEFEVEKATVSVDVVTPEGGIEYGDTYTPSIALTTGQKLAYDDTLADLTVDYKVPAELNASQTPYDITADATSDNYTVTVTAGKLTVKAKPLSKVTIAAIPDQTYTGKAIEPTLTVTNGTLPLVKDTDYTVESYAVDGSADVKLDKNGKPVDVGTYKVTIKAKSSNYEGENTAKFTIKAPETQTEPEIVKVTGVSLDQTSMTLTKGAASKLTATVTPDNAEDKTVTWSTSDPKVATVADDGTVTAVAKGSATITVTTNDGSKTATCDVTVIESTPDDPAPGQQHLKN